MIQALRHSVLPRTLHADEPSPHVDWSAGAVELLTEPRPWPAGERPRRAGVSSFGVSGTNAHVILEEAPPTTDEPASDAPAPWCLSARSANALRGQAVRLLSHVDSHPEHGLADVAHSLLTSRSRFPHRAVVLGDNRETLRRGLAALAAGEDSPTVVTGHADASEAVFVFPGQGSQWAGMGRALLESSPVFAARLTECAAALVPFTDFDLLHVLRRGEELDRVDVVQPALWAVMVSLAALWQSHGVRPAAVLGHSQGEIAAACVAGALSLSDGARVVALRSKALAALSGRGGMVSVRLPVTEVETLLRPWAGRISVAAVNGAASVVVSGEPDALTELTEQCGDLAKRIPVDYASHSAQVDSLRERLLTDLAPIRPRPAEVPFVSTVTAEPATLNAEYWFTNLREPVQFDAAMRRLLADGRTAFVELSPHPVLTLGMQQTAPDAVVAGALRRGDGGPGRVRLALAELAVRGIDVDWVLPPARRVDLPTYAFDHRTYWLTAARPAAGARSESTVDVREDGFAARLAGLTEAEQRRTLAKLVRSAAAAVLGHRSADEVDRTGSFRELGFDSAAGVQLRGRLAAATGLDLPVTVVFDHPTTTELAEHLRRELAGAPAAGLDRHLDALESGLRGLGGTDRVAVLTRLRDLVAEATSTDIDADAEDGDLTTASADEMFALLDRELGAAS
jgi:acyl transferase domain-containing protein